MWYAGVLPRSSQTATAPRPPGTRTRDISRTDWLPAAEEGRDEQRLIGRRTGPFSEQNRRVSGDRVEDESLYRAGDTRLVVAGGDGPAAGLQVGDGVAHHDRHAGTLQHLEIVQVVADGHDVAGGVAPDPRPLGERRSLGTASAEHVHEREVAERVFRQHQEGDDWDYAVIRHLGQKPTITIPAAAPAGAAADTRAWHTDTFVSGPAWADFTRQMGIGGSGKPGAVYVLGFHRAVPGHRTQLEQSLSAPSDSKVSTGTVMMRHIEGSDWQYLTITRYDSWQDFGTDRAAASAATAGGWADIRQHSAWHRDTIADRVFPVK